ncbi:MAG: Serine/threonine-protein kinase [Chrysothrix sp. TS-e1954]|nr:MAG: Serine/threonine-protein kinase [Chrysothrix sp. TS-e1954]
MDRANGPVDPRNPNQRLHLNFGYNERNLGADAGRAYPTTPSSFPQPVFSSNPNGQPEIWGNGQSTPSAYAGGPPSYFNAHAHVQYQQPQPQYPPQQNLQSPGVYRPPGMGGYNEGANGLAHQFANQNLGSPGQRAASPYGRQQSPANSRPRTAGPTPASAPGSRLAAPGSNAQSSGSSHEDELGAKTPEQWGDNVSRRANVTIQTTQSFFKDNVLRAKDRNNRAHEMERVCKDPAMDERTRQRYRNDLARGEAQYLRFLRTREMPQNFTLLKIIGKGAFGEVKLVRRKESDKIYALKSLVKSEMFRRDQLAHVRAERDILAESNSPWVVKLHTTFQDNTFLYMLMEFLPGGDLMTMLIKYEIFSEDITRFYMAELTLAIEAVHKLGFIHRDIKPDNILLDKGGHIKLTDFGLSTGFHKEHDANYYQQMFHGKPKNRDNRQSVALDQIQLTVSNRAQVNTWRKSRRQLAYSTVGTPDYIAPEIFTGRGYDFSCDWWSIGTIMFECMIGWPPFCADDSNETYRKIVDWPRHLHFPPDQQLHPHPENFIRSLICDVGDRLGSHGAGATEIKRHPFFNGVDFNALRKIRAPFEPKLNSAIDTQYFPIEDIPQQDTSAAIRARDEAAAANDSETAAEAHLPFVGYTYKRFEGMRG